MSLSLSNWASRHGHALLSTLGHLWRHWFATLLTVLVLGIALALPLSLDVLARNLRAVGGDVSDSMGMSVYLKPGVSEARARQLASTLDGRSGVAGVGVITSAQALEEFKRTSGFGAAFGALTDNPLPNVLTIRPTNDGASTARLEALRAAIAALPEVDTVQLDKDWVVRLHAILDLFERLLMVAAALLATAVIAIVGNTVRLEIQSRQAEIEVTKLVGGSNAFVRRPFLYTGTLYGLAAALIAFGMTAIAFQALSGPARRLTEAYGGQFSLLGPDGHELGLLVAVGVVLGWLGAWVAAARHIAAIEPKAD